MKCEMPEKQEMEETLSLINNMTFLHPSTILIKHVLEYTKFLIQWFGGGKF
jgi:hypothetical protein